MRKLVSTLFRKFSQIFIVCSYCDLGYVSCGFCKSHQSLRYRLPLVTFIELSFTPFLDHIYTHALNVALTVLLLLKVIFG